MEVKRGYKRTDVGVIPNEWECVAIADVARLESGHTPSKREPAYWGGTIPWVSLHDTDLLDGPEIVSTTQMITEDGLNNSSARLLPKGTVVFSRTATVGKATLLDKSMATSQDFANYVCGPRLHNHFLVYLFRGMGRTWQSLMAGSIHNTIYMPVFKSLKIALPPVEEQRAIAEALSDVDTLLRGLDQLIAKKRDLKQAAMQQLLTGQTRLPGFHGEWAVKSFSDVSWFQEGPGVRNTQFTSSGIKLLNGTNIFRGVLNLETTDRFIAEKEARGAYAHFMADEGDIVIASSGITIERLHEKVAFVRAQDLPFCMNTSTIQVQAACRRFSPEFPVPVSHQRWFQTNDWRAGDWFCSIKFWSVSRGEGFDFHAFSPRTNRHRRGAVGYGCGAVGIGAAAREDPRP
jgi:restriction endonuclease S subunit